MNRLTINPEPGFEAFVSDEGYFCIVSECLECGDQTAFAMTPHTWRQINAFFEAHETGGQKHE